jgi:hypothetical protein
MLSDRHLVMQWTEVVATRSASEMMALTDGITDRYKLLPTCELKSVPLIVSTKRLSLRSLVLVARLRFVSDLQMKLLNIYREDVESKFWRNAKALSKLPDNPLASNGAQEVACLFG